MAVGGAHLLSYLKKKESSVILSGVFFFYFCVICGLRSMRLVSENAVSRIEPEEALSVQLRKRFTAGFELNSEFTSPSGITIVFGASGAGKTTLLDCIAGLSTPDSGRIAIG